MLKKKLKDIAKLVNGYSFKSEKYVDNGLRIIRIANVQDGYISDESPCFYSIDFQNQLGEINLVKDDLLMSLTGNVGRVALLDESMLPAALNQRVECIRPFAEVSTKYLFNFFRCKRFAIDAIHNSTGSAQLNMSTKWLANYEIPIYSEDITEKINSELEFLDESIKNKKEQLNELDDLIKSRFICQEVCA